MRKFTNLLFFPLVLSVTMFSQQILADDGMIRLASPYSVSVTLDKLEAALKAKGMTIFTRISHSDGAKKVGIELRPTELLVFGNPKVGTPLMLCSQTEAIDLPQKALAYEDEAGKVWLVYNDAEYMAARHHVTGCDAAVKKVSAALAKFAAAATH